jgi:hypothetical protein
MLMSANITVMIGKRAFSNLLHKNVLILHMPLEKMSLIMRFSVTDASKGSFAINNFLPEFPELALL